MIDTSAQNALKNSIYNLIGFLVPVATFILITPVIIKHLGVGEYGVYIFLNTIVTFLGLLDLGIGVATNKHIIEYISTKQEAKLKKLIYSMNTVYVVIGAVFLLACLGVGYFVESHAQNSQTNYILLFLMIGVTSFLGSIFANFNNILVAVQRYDLHLKLSTFFFLSSSFSMLILAVLGYKLDVILFAQLIISTLSSLAYFFTSQKVFPVMKLKYAWDKTEIIKNYKYGLGIAFNNIASSSLVHFDKLIIPIFAGLAALSYYSVPGGITNKISSISGTLSSLLFPITVNLHSLNNLEKIKRVYIRSIRLITILSASISLSVIFIADKILLYWLSEDFAQKATIVLILLALTNFILAIFNPLSNLLMAMNKMKFLTSWSIAMAAVNLLALLLFLPKYGINGAAMAYLVGVSPIFFIFYLSEKRYFKENYFKNHLSLFFKLLAVAIPFFLIVRLLLCPFINSFLAIVLIAPICVLIFLSLFKLFGFVENEDWNDFIMFKNKILTKVK